MNKKSSLEDCFRKDPNVIDIERVISLFDLIMNILIISGAVVGFIVLIVILSTVGRYMGGGTIFLYILFTIIATALWCLGWYLFKVIVKIFIQSLANIEQNTKETSNLIYYLILNGIEKAKEATDKPETANNVPDTIIAPAESANNDGTEVKLVTEYIGDDMMKCPYCGTNQLRNRKICYNCSRELIKGSPDIEKTEDAGYVYCPSCSLKLNSKARFCPKCGTRISTTN